MTATPSSNRRVVLGWTIYDFANSAFTTVIVTFIYSAYFTDQVAPDPDTGLSLWSLAVSVSAVIIALLSPFVGAMADRGGLRKRYMLVTTVICVAGTVALFLPGPGQVMMALGIFVISNIAFEMSGVFYNAFLPDISTTQTIGRISGYGWAAGYIGGLLSLLVGYVLLVAPETPPFGLDKAAGDHLRASALVVAAWFAVFSIPTFLLVPESRVTDRPSAAVLFRSAARELRTTFANVRKYRNVFWLLIARLVYNDGLVTIFAFGGIYAMETFGFTFADLYIFGIGTNVAAGLGAWLFGFFDDRAGGRKTVFVTLAGLIVAGLLAVFAPTKTWFWVAALLAALLAGPNQSASRSLMGRFTPARHESEFFGFFAFSGKFTAFLGPLLLGQLAHAFQSQRVGVSVVVVFFVVGGLLLTRVNEREGMIASGRLES